MHPPGTASCPHKPQQTQANNSTINSTNGQAATPCTMPPPFVPATQALTQETERITVLVHKKTKEINLQQEMYKRYPFPPKQQAGVDLKEIHNNINKRLLQDLSTLKSQSRHLENTPLTPSNQFVQIYANTASTISTSTTPYVAASHRGLPPPPTGLLQPTALAQPEQRKRLIIRKDPCYSSYPRLG
jgi:hypothetical protein